METEKSKKKLGRPPKKNYNEEEQFQQLLQEVDYVYETTGEIKATALELEMNPIRVKKLLITSGKLEYEETKQIQRLLAYGKNMAEIQKEMNLKKSSINSYMPYSKLPYKEAEISANADRCDLYRRRKAAVEQIENKDTLLECLELFSNYKFHTDKGDAFSYICHTEEKQIYILECNIEISYKEITDAFEERSIKSDRHGEYIQIIFERFRIYPFD